MFVDYIKIRVKAGNGGDGATSFRREKYIPDGGPDGGDGGKGGNIVLKIDKDQSTLQKYRWNKLYKAEDGKNGSGSLCTGKSGEDLILGLPLGTIVCDTKGNILADMSEKGKEVILLEGGKGGLGNSHFKSSRRQAPNFSIDGDKTEEHEIVLELKTIADVGLLGFPNAGKSTILSRISRARPKIAGYPFTTLEPNLGVATDRNGRRFVVADIPGIIEGASEGIGLGLKFLRHVERCRLLLHVVDASGYEGNPLERFNILNEEVKKYSEKTGKIRQILCINKEDIASEEYVNELIDKAKENNIPYILTSGATNKNIDELLVLLANELEKIPKIPLIDEDEIKKLTSNEEDLKVNKVILKKGEILFEVTGKVARRIIGRINIDDNESMHYFHKMLEECGIIKELRKLGIKDGDIVNISGYEFAWYE